MNQGEKTEKFLSIVPRQNPFLAPVFAITTYHLSRAVLCSCALCRITDVSAVTLWENLEHLESPVQRCPGVTAKQEWIWSR